MLGITEVFVRLGKVNTNYKCQYEYHRKNKHEELERKRVNLDGKVCLTD